MPSRPVEAKSEETMDYKSIMREVPDFPKPGINFIDVTTLLKDAGALASSVKELVEPYRAAPPDRVVGIEARGFIFGAACTVELGCGFVPVRKPGKLPAETHSETYELEYGTDTLEIHTDAIEPGSRVLVIDDLLATGGTLGGVLSLLGKFDCEVIGAAFLVELTFLNGREKLGGIPMHSLVTYD